MPEAEMPQRCSNSSMNRPLRYFRCAIARRVGGLLGKVRRLRLCVHGPSSCRELHDGEFTGGRAGSSLWLAGKGRALGGVNGALTLAQFDGCNVSKTGANRHGKSVT